jgi:hypothetical protein
MYVWFGEPIHEHLYDSATTHPGFGDLPPEKR